MVQFEYIKSRYDKDYNLYKEELRILDDMEYKSNDRGPDWLGGIETEDEFWSHT